MKATPLKTVLTGTAFRRAPDWRDGGHSIIAEAAQRRLSPGASHAIEQLLGRGSSLTTASARADGIRDHPVKTFKRHPIVVHLVGDFRRPLHAAERAKGGDKSNSPPPACATCSNAPEPLRSSTTLLAAWDKSMRIHRHTSSIIHNSPRPRLTIGFLTDVRPFIDRQPVSPGLVPLNDALASDECSVRSPQLDTKTG